MSQWTVSLGEGASICTVLQRRRREQLAVLAVATRSGTCMQVVGAFGAALLSGSILQSLVAHFPGAGRGPAFLANAAELDCLTWPMGKAR